MSAATDGTPGGASGTTGGAGAATDSASTTTGAGGGTGSSGVTVDERILRTSAARGLLARPELGSVVGALAVFVFFAFVADGFLRASSLSTVLYASSTIGIMAVPVALLMIGGEFDLSAGVWRRPRHWSPRCSATR